MAARNSLGEKLDRTPNSKSFENGPRTLEMKISDRSERQKWLEGVVGKSIEVKRSKLEYSHLRWKELIKIKKVRRNLFIGRAIMTEIAKKRF